MKSIVMRLIKYHYHDLTTSVISRKMELTAMYMDTELFYKPGYNMNT